ATLAAARHRAPGDRPRRAGDVAALVGEARTVQPRQPLGLVAWVAEARTRLLPVVVRIGGVPGVPVVVPVRPAEAVGRIGEVAPARPPVVPGDREAEVVAREPGDAVVVAGVPERVVVPVVDRPEQRVVVRRVEVARIAVGLRVPVIAVAGMATVVGAVVAAVVAVGVAVAGVIAVVVVVAAGAGATGQQQDREDGKQSGRDGHGVPLSVVHAGHGLTNAVNPS